MGLASGAVAGMVAITPAAGFVGPMASLLIGALAAIASFTAVRLRPRFGLDDALDVFAVHGVAATLGALLTGVFASTAVNPAGADGSLLLVGKQALGISVTLLFSGGVSFLLYKVVNALTPLPRRGARRVDRPRRGRGGRARVHHRRSRLRSGCGPDLRWKYPNTSRGCACRPRRALALPRTPHAPARACGDLPARCRRRPLPATPAAGPPAPIERLLFSTTCTGGMPAADALVTRTAPIAQPPGGIER